MIRIYSVIQAQKARQRGHIMTLSLVISLVVSMLSLQMLQSAFNQLLFAQSYGHFTQFRSHAVASLNDWLSDEMFLHFLNGEINLVKTTAVINKHHAVELSTYRDAVLPCPIKQECYFVRIEVKLLRRGRQLRTLVSGYSVDFDPLNQHYSIDQAFQLFLQ